MDKPHIVSLMADDLGYGDVKRLNPDSKIPTPNLDRLAAQGMTFTDAHAPSAVCTPTRYGVLTGRYCWRSPLKSRVLWPWDRPLIDEGRLTVPAFLKSHGYHAAAVGKPKTADVKGVGKRMLTHPGAFAPIARATRIGTHDRNTGDARVEVAVIHGSHFDIKAE